MFKDQLALIVLLMGASMYASQDGIVYLCRYWLPAYYERKLAPLCRKIPRVELYYCDGLEICVKRGRTDDA